MKNKKFSKKFVISPQFFFWMLINFSSFNSYSDENLSNAMSWPKAIESTECATREASPPFRIARSSVYQEPKDCSGARPSRNAESDNKTR